MGRAGGLAGVNGLDGSQWFCEPPSLTILSLPLSMPLPSLLALLVMPAGLTPPLPSRQGRALLGAVPIAAIALPTDRYLLTTPSTHEGTARLMLSFSEPRGSGTDTHGCVQRRNLSSSARARHLNPTQFQYRHAPGPRAGGGALPLRCLKSARPALSGPCFLSPDAVSITNSTIDPAYGVKMLHLFRLTFKKIFLTTP